MKKATGALVGSLEEGQVIFITVGGMNAEDREVVITQGLCQYNWEKAEDRNK